MSVFVTVYVKISVRVCLYRVSDMLHRTCTKCILHGTRYKVSSQDIIRDPYFYSCSKTPEIVTHTLLKIGNSA